MNDKAKLSSCYNDSNVDFLIERTPRQLFNELFNEDVQCTALVNHHFKNSCFQQASVYPCAVDCFLEINYRVLLQHLNGFSRSTFFESMLIYGTLEYDSDDEDTREDNRINNVLSDIREATWSNIIRSCSTFRARDCNAEFSEIFSSKFLALLLMTRKIYFRQFLMPQVIVLIAIFQLIWKHLIL